jgi:hypothetical protein
MWKQGSGKRKLFTASHPAILAALSVFFMSMAMVMGPTPPGTGVMARHFGAASA